MGEITKIRVSELDHDEWMALRSETIGGSEIGAILGLNPYASAYSVWCQRTGRTAPFEGNLRTRIGTALEDTVARLFTEETGIQVQRSNFIWYNSDFPHMHASPDRLSVHGKIGLEIKTTSAFNNDKFRGEEFPAQYYAQAVQYMGILEYPVWYIAVLIGNHSLKIYQLVRDESIERPDWVNGRLLVEDGELDALKTAGNAFWYCLENDTPPGIDGSQATTDALDEMFETAENTQEPMQFFGRESLIDEWFDIKATAEMLEFRKNEIKNILCADMGLCETGFCGDHKVTWKNQPRKSFDSKTAVKDHPELEKYYKTSISRVFSIK